RTAHDRVSIRIAGRRFLSRRVVQLLPEGRQQIAPMIPVVHRPVDPALVEPDPAVVLAGQQVVGIERVEGDGLLRLTAEGAILVHPRVAIAVAARTAEGAGSNAQIRGGQVLSGAGRVCTLEALVTSADAERLPRGCD